MARRIGSAGCCTLLAVLLFAAFLPAASAAPAGSDSGAPRHAYALDFTLDMAQNSYSGTETVSVVNSSGDSWSTLCFRDYATVATLSSRDGYRDQAGREVFIEPNQSSARFSNPMDVTTGEVLTVRRDTHDPSIVYLDLPTPLPSGQSRTVRFQYSADIYHGRGNLCRWEADGVRYVNLGNFYPVLTVYEQGAWQAQPYDRDGEYFYTPVSDYSVTLTAPKEYVVAASVSGTATPVGDNLRWSYAGESLRDFALCLSDGFQILTGSRGETTVKVYYPAGQEDYGRRALETAQTALAFFGAQLGYPYPYDTFTVALSTMNMSGMEFPGMVIVVPGGSNFESTVVHETAHQWFYALVGSNSGAQPWLDETLSSFGELLYSQQHDQRRYEQMLDFFGPIHPPHSLGWSVSGMGDQYSWTVYHHAPQFLFELRAVMGADTFDASMGRYVKTYAMGQAHTAGFVDVFLKGCGWDKGALALMEEHLFPSYGDMEGLPARTAAALTSAYGLFQGTAAHTFSPNLTMTRAQAVTVLHRLSGSPAAGNLPAFADVTAQAWYAKAVSWAAERGITQGVGGGAFAPDRVVTQGEFLTLLARCGHDGALLEGTTTDGPLSRIQAAQLLGAILPTL